MTTTSPTANETAFHPDAPATAHLNRLMARAKAAMREVWHAYQAHRARQAAMTRLMMLDDRMLKDIGIDRSEIGSILMERARERHQGAFCSRTHYVRGWS